MKETIKLDLCLSKSHKEMSMYPCICATQEVYTRYRKAAIKSENAMEIRVEREEGSENTQREGVIHTRSQNQKQNKQPTNQQGTFY
jgi:hypothetical protein